MLKKILIILLPLALISVHIGQKINFYYQTKKEISQNWEKIENLQKENQELTEKKEYFQSEEYVRRQAREKLGLTAENEKVVILPELPDLSILKRQNQNNPNLKNWEKWWQLFFGFDNQPV